MYYSDGVKVDTTPSNPGVGGDTNDTFEPQDVKLTGSNGRLDTGQLSTVGKYDQHYLQPAAADAYKEMKRDAKAAGVKWGITDSYRDYDQQVDVYNRKGDYSQGGWAAKPGTSQHGWGLAVDLKRKGSGLGYGSRQFEWLSNNASKYGFENIAREPWHWQYAGRGAQRPNNAINADNKSNIKADSWLDTGIKSLNATSPTVAAQGAPSTGIQKVF